MSSIKSEKNIELPEENHEEAKKQVMPLQNIKEEEYSTVQADRNDQISQQLSTNPEDYIKESPKRGGYNDYSHADISIRQVNHVTTTESGFNENERASGFPRPERYDSYYVNQYSIPKSFHCGIREDKHQRK